jgi:Amt family ammonium transporter
MLAAFTEQVTTDVYLQDILYTLSAVFIMGLVLGLGLLHSATVKGRNVLDTWGQKLVAFIIGGAASAVIGYAIWNWQYYQAFGIEQPLWSAIKDWWIGGGNMTTLPQDLDPALVPSADVYQTFLVFFLAYCGAGVAFIHGVGVERGKPLQMYIQAALVGGLVMPVVIWLTWGSTSPLTNEGMHDFVGLFSLYMLVGVWSLVYAWRLDPKHKDYEAAMSATTKPLDGSGPRELSQMAIGAILVLVCVPFVVMGCGFVVPEAGYFGITMAASGWGILAGNLFAAYAGGLLMGAFIAYRTKNWTWLLSGPIAGYVSCTALLDISWPWLTFIVALFGPVAALLGVKLMHRLRINEFRIVPLTLLPTIYGAIMAGFVGWGEKQSGWFTITEGPYAFQHAEINVWWQLVGIGATIGITGIAALVILGVLEKTVGLRISDEDAERGFDAVYWSGTPGYEPAVLRSSGNGQGRDLNDPEPQRATV